MNAAPFFSAGSELAVLERHVRRLRASAHSPPVDRAECVLADIRGMILREHEAELQVRMATTAGFDEHRQIWEAKLQALDRRIDESTAVLHETVLALRLATFQRFAAASVIGVVALRHLFTPPVDGRPPPVLRAYLAETAFVSDESAAR